MTKDENGVKVDETEYKQVVGCLMYLAATRPNLMYVIDLGSIYFLDWSGNPRIESMEWEWKYVVYLYCNGSMEWRS